MTPRRPHPPGVAPDVRLGDDVRIDGFVNLYGCEIGTGTRVGPFVEIQRGVRIGARCKISSHTFICEGVSIGDRVFIGHGVMFTNDRLPRATDGEGRPRGSGDWKLETTRVEDGASIGSGSTLLPGITIGRDAMIGAGSTVTRSVPPGATVAGNPARASRATSA